MQVEAHSLEAGGSKQFGCLALSLHQVHFTPSNDNGEDAGISISTSQISQVRVQRAGDIQQQATAVPDLLPATSLQRAGRSASQQSNGSNNRSTKTFAHLVTPFQK